MEKFSFPYEPNGSQLLLMNNIALCIEKRKVGVMETCPGTDKTMSIICAALTWLEKYEANEKARIEKELKEVEAAQKAGENFPSEVSNETLLERDKIDERIRKGLEQLTNGQRRKYVDDQNSEHSADDDSDVIIDIDYPDYDNDDCPTYIDDEEDDTEEKKKAKNEPKPRCMKIFYAARTHSQLQHIADEVLKTRFRPRMVILGSQQHYCINESVRAMNNADLIAEQCNELCDNVKNECTVKICKEKCPFTRSDAIEDLCDQIVTTKLLSSSELIDCGKKISACPYHTLRAAVPYAQLVLLPYEILFQEEARHAWGIYPGDSIIVIDESHDLPALIGKSYSVTMHARDLHAAYKLLCVYVYRYNSRLKLVHVKYLRRLISLLEDILQYIFRQVADIKDDHFEERGMFYIKAHLEKYKLRSLLKYIERTHLVLKLDKFLKRNDEENRKFVRRKSGAEGASEMEDIGINVFSKNDSMPSLEKDGEALTALRAFKRFLQLFLSNYDDDTLLIECSSDRNHASLTYFLLNPEFQFASVMAMCRSLILVGNVMRPTGELIRSLVDECRKTKALFIEKPNSPSGFFEEFAEQARTEKGALLFAVIGGKLTEGVIFSDEVGQTVVLVGLPFIHIDNVVVQQKFDYMDNTYGTGAGMTYHQMKCMSTINHALGSAIGHRNDRAAVIMLDVRYSDAQLRNSFPSWFKPIVYHMGDLANGIVRLKKFFHPSDYVQEQSR